LPQCVAPRARQRWAAQGIKLTARREPTSVNRSTQC
jgi:hypothetical protein